MIELYLNSLIPKGAKSIFVTSEKNAFLCANLDMRLYGKLNIEFTILLAKFG